MSAGMLRAARARQVGELATALAAAPAAVTLQEAAGRGRDDETVWRRIGDTKRDLPPMTAHRAREVSVYLYTHNPPARRIINLIGEWVWGEGATLTAQDPRAQTQLQAWWKSPASGWLRQGEKRTRELWLFGEQLWPVFTNQVDGRMTLGVLDPSRVKQIVLDPENAHRPIGVILRGEQGGQERRLRTVLRQDDVLSLAAERERERFTDGETFFFSVNGIGASCRGIPELFSLADVLDGWDQMLWSTVQSEMIRNRVVYDVTVDGADDRAIAEFLKNNPPPKALTVKAHNEKVKWEVKGPPAGSASNAAENLRSIRNHALGAESIPEHFYGGGGDVNRAVGAEMAPPFEKAMTARQRTMQWVAEDTAVVQVERWIEAGVLSDRDGVRDVTVAMPDLSTRDLGRVAQAIAGVGSAMVQAMEEGLFGKDVAVRVYSSLLGQMGVRVDPEEMLAGASNERAPARLVDQVTRDLEDRAGRRAA